MIHPGALGDVLQSIPALRALAADGPVQFSGQPRLGALVKGLALVDSEVPFDGLGLEALFTREPVPAALAARLAGARQIVSWFGSRDELYPGRLRRLAPGCVVAPPVPSGDDARPVWRYLLDTVGGRADDRVVAPVEVPAPWRQDAGRALAGLGVGRARGLLVVHPGAAGRAKVWPVSHVARVIERVIEQSDADVVVHQGPADREAVEELLSLIDGPVPRLVEPGLPLLSGVLAAASAYLGGDTGVSHLAAAVGAPAVILYPAATRARWAPWSETARALTMGGEDGAEHLVATVLVQRTQAAPRGARSPGS